MSTTLSERESELAGRVGKLNDAAGRPKIENGGMIGEALNFISAHVPPVLIQLALVVFLGFHAWDYYNRAQQMVAEVESKQAEAVKSQAEADALNKKIDGDTIALATLKADLEKTQADAATAAAEAQAQGAVIRGNTVRLSTLRAELETTRAEGAKAQAEADALTQIIGGLPAAVAQKKAEVEKAEAEVQQRIEAMRYIIKSGSDHAGSSISAIAANGQMTRVKLVFMNTVIVAGSIAIAVLQWPEAARNSGFGSGGYNQGMVGTVLLELLMAGIPIVLFASAAYLGLSRLLFRRGELDEYRKRKIIDSVIGENRNNARATPGAETTNNSLN